MLRRLTVFLLLVINTAAADDLSLPNTLSNNSVADANDVQQNFQALVDESNENDQRLDEAEVSIDTFESYFPADRTSTINASGWYTIAYLPCANGQVPTCVASTSQQKGSAYFMVRSDTGGKHQLLILYASSLYGQSALKVLQSKTYSQQPLTNIRVKQGATYDGGLLQVYVDTNGGSANVTARLTGREHEGNDNGWNLVNWVADGDAIDSIDYGLLTLEVLKPIPTKVQYLADFSCTAGQVIEWNNTRSQWECSDLPAAGERIVWVDANGTVVGEYMPVLSNRTNGFEISQRIDGSSRLYQSSTLPLWRLLGYGLDGLLRKQRLHWRGVYGCLGWVNMGHAGYVMAPTEKTTTNIDTRDRLTYSGCNTICTSGLIQHQAGSLWNAVKQTYPTT